MATYFCFSDECGDYRVGMTSKQLVAHPFYIRSTLIINSDEWKALSIAFKELKSYYDLPLSKEIKWSYLWNLKHFQIKKKRIPIGHEIRFLHKYDYDLVVEFVGDALNLINQLTEKKIIITYTNNTDGLCYNEKRMLSMHLQEHMQRVEMELAGNKSDDLAVIFFDPVSPEKNEYLRELYFELFESGDYVNYSHIKDSLNIENSHHSVGIQLADYISGAFSSLVKSSPKSINYADGVKMYFDSVHENLRRSWSGGIQGYGIREVPSSRNHRQWLIKHLKNLKPVAV